MAIDGIGKPPGSNIPPAGGVGGVSDASRASEAFKVGSAAPLGAASTSGAKVSEALSSLQRGEVSLDQYLDTRVNEATSHLAGKLNPDQLEFVKQSLREQMATDPVLVELVQRTTGSVPTAELR